MSCSCPICTGDIEPKTVITCIRCWWFIPTLLRQRISRMYRVHQFEAEKRDKALAPLIAKAKRLVCEKHKDLKPNSVKPFSLLTGIPTP